ncbi:MAG: METTL5 family protein [Nanoarchaeota archaeon]|nr:METTL5 family protein [Nanoarchaeota archaeon]MBU1622720.1 METTL5 family protein [Nanoarchaeota archaeon]MBU1974084.1 METTL5 family protein [Nanoarchaeota archaeon]
MTIRSQKDLEIQLSKLQEYTEPSFELEQYATPAHIAAEWIWSMALKGEVAGKIILDAACGPGILGIGLLLMGARKVYFLDKDEKIIQVCIENYNQIKKKYEIGEAEFIIEDVTLFDAEVDIVVQNPPFGTKEKHIDKIFLEKAFSTAKVVYSMHKYSTKRFVEAISSDHEFKITDLWRYEFPLKKMFKFHTKPVRRIDVGLWRMEKG